MRWVSESRPIHGSVNKIGTDTWRELLQCSAHVCLVTLSSVHPLLGRETVAFLSDNSSVFTPRAVTSRDVPPPFTQASHGPSDHPMRWDHYLLSAGGKQLFLSLSVADCSIIENLPAEFLQTSKCGPNGRHDMLFSPISPQPSDLYV